jgi:hypothetical protein
MAALLDEALEGLRAHTRSTYTNNRTPTAQAPARPAGRTTKSTGGDPVDKGVMALSPEETG